MTFRHKEKKYTMKVSLCSLAAPSNLMKRVFCFLSCFWWKARDRNQCSEECSVALRMLGINWWWAIITFSPLLVICLLSNCSSPLALLSLKLLSVTELTAALCFWASYTSLSTRISAFGQTAIGRGVLSGHYFHLCDNKRSYLLGWCEPGGVAD